MMALIAFGGFCFENLFVAVTLGYIDNKNMVLPFLLGYGMAVAAIYLLFGLPTRPLCFGRELKKRHTALHLLTYFCIVFLVVSAGELAIGTFVEEVCDVTWWDYSGIPLHLTKFVSVPTSTAFSVLMMLLVQFVYHPLYQKAQRLPKKLLYPLSALLLVLMVADCTFSGIRMYLTGDFMVLWRIDLF